MPSCVFTLNSGILEITHHVYFDHKSIRMETNFILEI